MNAYLKNLNRIEYVITNACTGKCKHCSEGGQSGRESIDKASAVSALLSVTRHFPIKTVMTFGGEPLLFPETVCAIHSAARDCGIEKRQIITNGFFTNEENKIISVADALAESGVTEIMLSVDAFHQETIPIEPVKTFALAIKERDILIRTHPAWLVSKNADNVYNQKTHEILDKFSSLGIFPSDGNIIFPAGNALKYLSEYFTDTIPNPYEEDPRDIRSLSFCANGDVLDSNIYGEDILDIIKNYKPEIEKN